MRHFSWSPEHEVFIGQIDAEHRDLFEIAERLERALENHAPPEETNVHLHSLTAHVQDHLSHEEWLMQSVSYPSYGWHKQQHETARKRIRLFTPLVESGNAEAADLFLEFLATWLQDHTSVTDRMMAAYVRNYERLHAAGALERWGETAKPTAAEKRATAAVAEVGPYPKTIRMCPLCGQQTTQEIRASGFTCMKCEERHVSAELDRD
jgi:hemerythrin-like metal-binding protein